nr:PREDICTED: PX domain-containing protein 1 [Bos indicus]
MATAASPQEERPQVPTPEKGEDQNEIGSPLIGARGRGPCHPASRRNVCRKENVSSQYSRSEVVLTFFERSPLDQVLKNDNVHKIQCGFQSPVKISEIMRSNGFCLANTETIVIDHSIPNGKDQHGAVDPAEHLFEGGGELPAELEDGDDPAAYVTNLSYYHLVPFETDILD